MIFEQCSSDPSMYNVLFTYDYDKIRHDRLHIKKGIIENRFHPKNMKYFKGWGYEDFDEFEE